MFITSNHIRLHITDHEGNGVPVLLAHGLTANGHAFEGLLAEGLGDFCRPFTIDLRGRGLSEAPDDGYTMLETAKDILGVLDALHLEKVVMAGHSYGAFVSWYMAAHYPERIIAVIAMDAAMRMNPRTMEMLGPSLSRLGKYWESFKDYISEVKQAPYLTFWDDKMESYYRSDTRETEDGRIMAIPNPSNMKIAALNVLAEPWNTILPEIEQPVLMIHASENYTLGEPLLPEKFARETALLFPEIQFVQVNGNHQTMLYGPGAKACVQHMKEFLKSLN